MIIASPNEVGPQNPIDVAINWTFYNIISTLWWTNIAIEAMAIEIVSFPIKMVIFHGYVSSPEGICFFDG